MEAEAALTWLWSWWLARVNRMEDARPLAAVRIGVSIALVLDLLNVLRLGLVDVLFIPYDAGGLSDVQDSAYILGSWLPPTFAGRLLFGTSLGCFVMTGLGVLTRPATIIGVLAYAQLGHLYPPGDRAIDRLLRSVLLILLFSGAHRRWALGGGEAVQQVRGWASDLIRTLLVVLYMSAGISKLMMQPRWLALHGTPVLYRIMTDPLAAHMDPVAMMDWTWPLRVLGWGTILMECSGFLIYTRLAPYWAVPGLMMHLGIAFTMELGMFSWGMMAFYPLLFAPWWLPRLIRRDPAAGAAP